MHILSEYCIAGHKLSIIPRAPGPRYVPLHQISWRGHTDIHFTEVHREFIDIWRDRVVYVPLMDVTLIDSLHDLV